MGCAGAGVHPAPPLPVPYILEPHPPWCVPAQRGTTVCTFVPLPPEKWGKGEKTAGGGHTSPDGVGSWLGGGHRRLGGAPCGRVGDLLSAKHFPLSRSKKH